MIQAKFKVVVVVQTKPHLVIGIHTQILNRQELPQLKQNIVIKAATEQEGILKSYRCFSRLCELLHILKN